MPAVGLDTKDMPLGSTRRQIAKKGFAQGFAKDARRRITFNIPQNKITSFLRLFYCPGLGQLGFLDSWDLAKTYSRRTLLQAGSISATQACGCAKIGRPPTKLVPSSKGETSLKTHAHVSRGTCPILSRDPSF